MDVSVACILLTCVQIYCHRAYKTNVADFFKLLDSMCNSMLASSAQNEARKKTGETFKQIKLVDQQRQAAMTSRQSVALNVTFALKLSAHDRKSR